MTRDVDNREFDDELLNELQTEEPLQHRQEEFSSVTGEPTNSDPDAADETHVAPEPVDTAGVERFLNLLADSLNQQHQAAAREAGPTNTEQDASASERNVDLPTERHNQGDEAADEAQDARTQVSHSPARRLDFGPRRLPPPTPFEQLVMDMTAARQGTPESEPGSLSTQPAVKSTPGATDIWPVEVPRPAAEQAPVAVSVSVHVSLTDEAIRRAAEEAARELAGSSQRQLEIVAKRLFDLDQEIFAREANRRALYRY